MWVADRLLSFSFWSEGAPRAGPEQQPLLIYTDLPPPALAPPPATPAPLTKSPHNTIQTEPSKAPSKAPWAYKTEAQIALLLVTAAWCLK